MACARHVRDDFQEISIIMYLKILVFFLTGIHVAFLQTTTPSAEPDTNAAPGESSTDGSAPAAVQEFVGGVVECLDSETVVPDAVKANFDKYKNFITEAAEKKCNILVFPEASLVGNLTIRKADQVEKCSPPSDKDESISPKTVMQQLSCLAKDNKMILVIHSSAEECSAGKKCLTKNVHFVYGSDGTLKKQFTSLTSELKVIDTDFGKFALICERDLYNKKLTASLIKSGIKNVISTVSNQNNAPLFSAVAMQAGWAYAYDITLLSAGFGYSANPNLFGSGIYMGKKGPIATFMTNQKDNCKLLTATVKAAPDPWAPENTMPPPKMDKVNLKNFKQENIDAKTETILKKLCHRTFCCDFDIKFTKTEGRKKREDTSSDAPPAEASDSPPSEGGDKKPNDVDTGIKTVHYRMVVYSGKFKFIHIQVCSVIACLNEKLDTCDDLDATVTARSVELMKINGSFTPSTLTMPMVFNRYYLPLKVDLFDYKASNKSDITLTSKSEIVDFSSFGIIGQNTAPNVIGFGSGANDLKLLSMRHQRQATVWGKFLYRTQIAIVFLVSTFIFY